MDETQVLPLFSGIITAKVLRIDSGSSAKRKLFVKKNLNPKFGKDSASDGAAAPVVPKSAKSNQQPPAAAQVQASRPPVAPPIAPQPPKPQEEPAPFIDLFNGMIPSRLLPLVLVVCQEAVAVLTSILTKAEHRRHRLLIESIWWRNEKLKFRRKLIPLCNSRSKYAFHYI